MDFNTLGKGSTFYILREGNGGDTSPVLEIGSIKEKTVMPQPMQYGLNVPQKLNITVTVDGSDRIIPDIPANIEIAQRGKETYTGNLNGILQAIDSMMARSQANLDNRDYDERVLSVGERMKEKLNPLYAKEKDRDRTIEELVNHRKETDSKLDQILAFMKDLTSPSKK